MKKLIRCLFLFLMLLAASSCTVTPGASNPSSSDGARKDFKYTSASSVAIRDFDALEKYYNGKEYSLNVTFNDDVHVRLLNPQKDRSNVGDDLIVKNLVFTDYETWLKQLLRKKDITIGYTFTSACDLDEAGLDADEAMITKAEGGLLGDVPNLGSMMIITLKSGNRGEAEAILDALADSPIVRNCSVNGIQLLATLSSNRFRLFA